MISTLKNAKRVIGIKQVTKAVKNHLAKCVYIADDADDRVLSPLKKLCRAEGIELIPAGSMAELGKACNIEVGAAAAALLKADAAN